MLTEMRITLCARQQDTFESNKSCALHQVEAHVPHKDEMVNAKLLVQGPCISLSQEYSWWRQVLTASRRAWRTPARQRWRA